MCHAIDSVNKTIPLTTERAKLRLHNNVENQVHTPKDVVYALKTISLYIVICKPQYCNVHSIVLQTLEKVHSYVQYYNTIIN